MLAEKDRVKSLGSSSTATSLIVNDLRKYYGQFNAVKGVNFHVNAGECFGLLGIVLRFSINYLIIFQVSMVQANRALFKCSLAKTQSVPVMH